MELTRSLLFVPGNRPSMLEKAINLPADIIIPDLEDSVPVSEKSRARDRVAAYLPIYAQANRKVVVRINSLETGLLQDDLISTVGTNLYGISVGKIRTPDDIQKIDSIISSLEKTIGLKVGTIRILPWIETANAILNLSTIAAASPRLMAMAFGAEDFTEDMGIERTEEGLEIQVPRALVPIAACAGGLPALDTPYTNYRDTKGLECDIKLAVRLGYRGKFAIHPSQIDPINTLFRPSVENVEYARKIIAVFEEAEGQGRASIAMDGKMVDVPIYKRALRIIKMDQEITDAVMERGCQ